MKNIFILSCTCLAVASCAALGKYQPVEEVSATLYGDVAGNTSSESIANFSWKEVFTDPLLQDLIGTALENNIDLKVAEEHIAQAEAQLTGAKLAYIPTLGVGAAGQANFSGEGSTYGYGLSASSSWQLNIFRLINNQKSAKVSVEQMNDYRQAVQSKVIAGVANTYLALLMLDSQLETAKEMQSSWKESVETVIALKEAGLADQVAVSQYEANLNSINITVTTLEENIAATQNAMNLLLAKEPGSPVSRGKLIEQKIPENISAGVPVLMLTLRPDIRAAQRSLELAHYSTRGAILNYFPTLTLTGEASLLSPVAEAVASLAAPILTAGKNRAAQKTAESKEREAQLSFAQALLEAGKEVNDAYLSYETCRKMAEDYNSRAISLAQAKSDTEYLMLNSLDKTYLDVLYANTNFLEAKLNAIANHTQMFQSIVTLYAALGGGSI